MPICVKSEIGPLKRVLLQRPGRELEHLSPNTMGQLLFDDIPYLYGAQREHDCFAQILRDNGAEVVYLEDLTAQVLAGDEELRRRFVEETIRRARVDDQNSVRHGNFPPVIFLNCSVKSSLITTLLYYTTVGQAM